MRERTLKDYYLSLLAEFREFLNPYLLSLLAIFAPIQATAIVICVVIFVDLITGMIAAHKRGETIHSAGLRRTITKVFVYQTAVMIGFLIENYLIGGVIPISKLAAGLIGVTEALSIFENLNSIHGGNVFKYLLVKLGSANDTGKKED